MPSELKHGNEALEQSEVCIRVMERFFERVDDNPALRANYAELYGIYADILDEELAPHAFDLAVDSFRLRS